MIIRGKRMKNLLINPPQTFFPGSDPPAANLPLGLMYIAAVLDEAGVKTEILDAFMSDLPLRKNGDTTEVTRKPPSKKGGLTQTQNF